MNINVQELATNPFITLAGFVIAVISFLLAIFFYFRSQKNKVPCFDYTSSTIIEGINLALEGLEVNFNGQQQERVTVTKLVLWNAGRETIDRNDIAERDKLRIIIPKGVTILDIAHVDSSVDSNEVRLGDVIVENGGAHCSIDFDFLEHNEYVVIQIVHDGSSDEKFKVKGKIKGAKEVLNQSKLRSTQQKFRILPTFMSIIAFLLPPKFMKYFGTLLYLLIGLFSIYYLIQGKTDWYVWCGAILGPIFACVVATMHRHIAPIKI
ncbi:hypothetical protein ACEC18_002765 [Vibrio parahaemolyticus]